MPNRRLVAAVAENVVAPLAVYGALVLVGLPPVWALVGSGIGSGAIVAAGYRRTGEISALGSLVLVRLVLSVAVAAITGDARLVLVKDAAVTAGLASVMAGTLLLRRPLVARIRRDIDADPVGFDRRWRVESAFRSAHRRVTGVWVVGLFGEAALVLLVVQALPLDAAVVLSRVIPLGVLLALIGWTQRRLAAVPAGR